MVLDPHASVSFSAARRVIAPEAVSIWSPSTVSA